MNVVHIVELNTMEYSRGWHDETPKVMCPKCRNIFRLGYGMDVDREMEAISNKHLELCEADAAVTLLKIDAEFKKGWRP
jgi:hypothetical protein